MENHPANEALLERLHEAVERLAEAVSDDAPIAGALRRFACTLPRPERALPRGEPRRRPMRDLLYRALDEGALDARRFDWLMLVDNRAARAIEDERMMKRRGSG